MTQEANSGTHSNPPDSAETDLPEHTAAAIQDAVARVERGEQSSHPVVQVLLRHREELLRIKQEYSILQNDQARWAHRRRTLGFFADAIVEAGNFALGPEDIIQIWAVAIKLLENTQRYVLARIVSWAFAIQGLSNSAWRQFPRQLLETQTIPTEVQNDTEGIQCVERSLQQTFQVVGSIIAYADSHRPPVDEALDARMEEMRIKGKAGDAEALKTYFEYVSEKFSNDNRPLLGTITENFSNGAASPPFGNALSELRKAQAANSS